jgi:hypothetical protein
MDLVCPECRGDLAVTSVGWAVCAQHGGRYEVLFDRYAAPAAAEPAPEAVPAPPLPADAMCVEHPRHAAVGACPACAKNLCALCSFDVNGRSFCSDCAMAEANMPASAPSPTLRRRTAVGGVCADHPGVEAVARCRVCAKGVCVTCDFALPGGVHVCPRCVESDSTSDVSPKRKKLTYIALALAVWSTILTVLMFSGAFKSLFTDDAGGKAADLILTNITLWPLLIGTGLSMSAMDKKLKNTGLMKAVAWWNGTLAGVFLLIVIAANLGLIG